jgi:hypothetical protein
MDYKGPTPLHKTTTGLDTHFEQSADQTPEVRAGFDRDNLREGENCREGATTTGMYFFGFFFFFYF